MVFLLLVTGALSFGALAFYLGFAVSDRHRRPPVSVQAPLVMFGALVSLPAFVLFQLFARSAPLPLVLALVPVFLALGAMAGWYYYLVIKTQVIGVTGTIASGKSLVGKIFEQEGVPVIDTDHVVHELLAGDPEVHRELRALFGDQIFLPEGGIDRKKLRFVFKDPQAKAKLEAVLHPRVRQECRRRIALMHNQPLVVVLVPLLFEAGLEREYDEVWTVVASDDVVRARLKKRDNLSDDEVNARLAAQFPQEEKARRSHRVIDNSGTVDDTRAVVLSIIEKNFKR